MPLTFLLGGARSGKSALAVRIASEWGGPVVFVATAEARDDLEMSARIARHRLERPPAWTTVEEPLDLTGALAHAPEGACLVVDCLTLWAANALERDGGSEPVLAAAARAAQIAAARPGLTVAISNEVGLGIVPATELGRVYRDLLGSVNRLWVDAAAEADFVIAGRILPPERIAP